MKQFKISAKNLAQLNMPNACKCCFKSLLHLHHKTPFNIFPSIFSTFDSLQKQLVESTLEETGKFPKWLGEMADAVGLADYPPRMEYVHQGNNIVLVGVPDHVLQWKDTTVSPIDYKTSRYSKGQDSLKPLYEAQLDAYSYLLNEKCGLESDRGALVYFEPTGFETMVLTDQGYTQPWKVSVCLIDVSGETTLRLLDEARELYELKVAPDGRAECPDCELLEKMAAVAMQHNMKTTDALRFMTAKERAVYVAEANYRKNTAHLGGGRSTDTVPSAEYSLMLAWDWSN